MKSIIMSLVTVFSFAAFADVAPTQPDSVEDNVAVRAMDVFSVDYFKVGNRAYKIVQLDSSLNGDLGTTTILATGEGAVGGAAGYDAAFVITPYDKGETTHMSLRSFKVLENGKIELTLMNGNFEDVKRVVWYDEATKTLKEE